MSLDSTKLPLGERIKRIKGRYRYELRDPALPQTTVDDMTALLDSHDELERRIAEQSKDSPTDDEPAASWAFASSLTAASEMYHDEKHGPMCTCELSKLLREFAGGMMTERCKAADERRTEQSKR